MRRLLRVLGAIWSLIGTAVVLASGYWMGMQVGYGKGARAIADLMIEMRHTDFETPDPWDRGDI